jgi:4-amino-4-deoxy-L-arabinose transferase-like glycosyltransferase
MALSSNIEKKAYIIIVVLGILLFFPYLGTVHLFDWDEINFAEAAREMIVTGDYLTVRIDYKPFHEKPPLFIQMQALSMLLFGVSEFSARLPNALIGIISLLVIYHIGKKLFDYKFGLIWVLAYIGSILPNFYFKTGIIDPTFNLFMFLSIYYIYRFYSDGFSVSVSNDHHIRYAAIAGVFVMLAIMTKGPVGYLLPVLTWSAFWFSRRKLIKFPIRAFGYFTLIAAIVPLTWYILVLVFSAGDIFEDFISYHLRLLSTEDAGHGGPIYYHFFVLLFGCFPSSIVMLRAFRKDGNDDEYQYVFKSFMVILLSVVVIVFSLVSTKIVHYSSLAYFPITFLAAYTVYKLSFANMEAKRSTIWLLSIIGTFWGLLLTGLPLILINSDWIIPKISDDFTREILKTPVQWMGIEYFIGLFYLLIIFISVILLVKKKQLKAFTIIFGGTAVVMFTFLPLVASRIEQYTQGTAIEFYKSMQGKKAYIHILDIGNYKYGHLFYAKKPPELSSVFNGNIPKTNVKEWLMTGEIDFPAYFITKNTRSKKYLEQDDIQFLYEKNGFVIMFRGTANNE